MGHFTAPSSPIPASSALHSIDLVFGRVLFGPKYTPGGTLGPFRSHRVHMGPHAWALRGWCLRRELPMRTLYRLCCLECTLDLCQDSDGQNKAKVGIYLYRVVVCVVPVEVCLFLFAGVR